MKKTNLIPLLKIDILLNAFHESLYFGLGKILIWFRVRFESQD